MTTDKAKENGIIIRFANREDCIAIMELKKELADHHGMGHLPWISVEELQRDGFDEDPPYYHCLVAEIPNPECESKSETELKIVGYALYFYAFVVWEGKALHLEDICVSKAARGTGLGSKLIRHLAKIALEDNCARIQLEVSEFNDSGQKFYDSFGGWNSTKAEGWHNFRFDKEAIKRLVGNTS